MPVLIRRSALKFCGDGKYACNYLDVNDICCLKAIVLMGEEFVGILGDF